MSDTRTIYEGDSGIHIMPSATHAGGEHITAELEAWTRRIDAVWNAFRTAGAWFDRQGQVARSQERKSAPSPAKAQA